MMRTVWASTTNDSDLNRSLSMWASFRIFGHINGFPQATTMGVFDGHKLIAVMVYHGYSRQYQTVEVSGAAVDSRWLTRSVLREMFSTPFKEWDIQLLCMRVSDNNKSLHRMLKAYGFEGVRIPRLRGRDEGEVIFTLTAEAWATNKFNRNLSKQNLQTAA